MVRELTGDVYFGTPKGIVTLPNSSERQGFNNMVYTESEIRRIAKVGIFWVILTSDMCEYVGCGLWGLFHSNPSHPPHQIT